MFVFVLSEDISFNMWLILLLFAVGYLFYVKCLKPLGYWKKRNVPYSHAIIFMGMMTDVVFKRKSFFDVILEVYNKYPDKRFATLLLIHVIRILIMNTELNRK